MRNEPLNRILLAAVIILAIGEGYLLYQNGQLRAAGVGGTAPAISRSASSTAAAPLQALTNILIPLSGTIENISGSTLTLSGPASSTIKVAVGSDTTIVEEGALKDAATYQSDLEKFHQESDQLMQNPQKSIGARNPHRSLAQCRDDDLALAAFGGGEHLGFL